MGNNAYVHPYFQANNNYETMIGCITVPGLALLRHSFFAALPSGTSADLFAAVKLKLLTPSQYIASYIPIYIILCYHIHDIVQSVAIAIPCTTFNELLHKY